jgi:hypothetical protein
MPLRRIVRREQQDGAKVTVLECGHASPGWSDAGRFARFYPCPACHEVVRAIQAKAAESQAAALEALRAAAPTVEQDPSVKKRIDELRSRIGRRR